MNFPLFLTPLEVMASERLTFEEKAVFGSLDTWTYTDRPADWGEIAGRVGVTVERLFEVMEDLKGKGLVISWSVEKRGYRIRCPEWLAQEAAAYACDGWVTVIDEDGEMYDDWDTFEEGEVRP